MRFEPRKTENRNCKGWAVYDTRDACLNSGIIYKTRTICEAVCAENEVYWAEIDAANAREDALREEEAARKATTAAARRVTLQRTKALAASQLAFAF